jgi:hypothetical protein
MPFSQCGPPQKPLSKKELKRQAKAQKQQDVHNKKMGIAQETIKANNIEQAKLSPEAEQKRQQRAQLKAAEDAAKEIDKNKNQQGQQHQGGVADGSEAALQGAVHD